MLFFEKKKQKKIQFIGPNPQQYVDEVMFPQMYDLINNYQPEIFWTDG